VVGLVEVANEGLGVGRGKKDEQANFDLIGVVAPPVIGDVGYVFFVGCRPEGAPLRDQRGGCGDGVDLKVLRNSIWPLFV
jgi:hypothetical protein